MTDLKELIERVESGIGQDTALDGDVWCEIFAPDAVVIDPGVQFPPYTSSLDAVLALIKAELPDWGFGTTKTYQPAQWAWRADAWRLGQRFDGNASSPARALLAAALRAIASTAPQQESK